jgi:hypothetical protein
MITMWYYFDKFIICAVWICETNGMPYIEVEDACFWNPLNMYHFSYVGRQVY